MLYNKQHTRRAAEHQNLGLEVGGRKLLFKYIVHCKDEHNFMLSHVVADAKLSRN